ncbi:hypothetical protein TUMSATVNIG1_57750 (plasmid) [Vibrio nigripulchritudo]|nr:hypothetical protein VNTUMSATTG_57260 [Vibrio nigripulchritudo]BDU35166.1 hypothetical protein TUMSATVNIG1_57750 [Vibrio nigripulchritudo]
MGTNNAMKKAGAPAEVRSQGNTILLLVNESASFVLNWAINILKKLPGTSLQAESDMPVQARASSSFESR